MTKISQPFLYKDAMHFIGSKYETPVNLPFDILLNIALTNIHSWRAMLSVPHFVRNILGNPYYRELAITRFLEIKINSYEIRYLLDGKLHSIDDKPAVIRSTGEKRWYRCGKLYRENNLPVIIKSDGDKVWYNNGTDSDHVIKIQRYISDIYEVEWYKNGKLHRDDDLPAKIKYINYRFGCDSQIMYWFQHGKLHRDGNKPSVVFTGRRILQFHKHGKLHRDGDKPAIISLGPSDEWYQRGKKPSERERKSLSKIEIDCDNPACIQEWISSAMA
jgi:hypothetical protein